MISNHKEALTENNVAENETENDNEPDEKGPMLENDNKKDTSPVDDPFEDMPITEETMCGVWCIRSPFLQRFANKKAYVFLYGFLGCAFSACYAYSTATITTIEKRFKIPSRNTGIITVGNDISQLFASLFLSYYAGRGHRPRWMAFGMYTVVLYCFLTALPHFLYGSGEDALMLTKEYSATTAMDSNETVEFLERHRRQMLCEHRNSTHCELEDGNMAPQLILFIAQFISGLGGSLYYTLGVSYMDDNIKKSKTPALISFSYFLRMLGPAIGYALASFCLKLYISPGLTPTINNNDPRWLGAWWIGWGILGVVLMFLASLLALFPKTLPRAAARRAKLRSQTSECKDCEDEPSELPTSMKDMMKTFKRLLSNVILMMNNLSSVFYFLGYMPYWIFMPKYIETQYRQSASFSSLITGTVGLVFSAFGILLSGLIITKFKPSARFLAGWNVVVGTISVLGIMSYAYLGCAENNVQTPLLATGELETHLQCNSNCSCDYVKYSPVCSQDGHTYISACHAGCKSEQTYGNASKIYTDCSCVSRSPQTAIMEKLVSLNNDDNIITEAPTSTSEGFGFALPGNCPIDCTNKFYIFLTVVCILKFFGATGRLSNFLVSVRCVEEKDKAVAMGFGLMIMSLCAFIPSPILFGVILDKACMVWGKTCSGTGNCWLYNGETLRYTMNFTAAGFVTIGTLFDAGVWYYVKNIKIFDEEIELKDKEEKK